MKHPDAHTTTRETKRARRAKRERDRGRGGKHAIEPAFSGFDPAAPWPDVRERILPLLKRRRHPYPTEAAPIHLLVPPGIPTGFGLDLGIAWAHVSRQLLDQWGVGEAELLATSLGNLRARIAEEPIRVERATFGDQRATVVQAVGWGSALILVPDRLVDVIGEAPRTILTPVRNTLVALPVDTDPYLAIAIWEAFAEEPGDELEMDPMHWTGSTVTSIVDHAEPIH